MIQDISLTKAVEFAIKTEQLGAAFYDRLATKFAADTEVAEVFSVLARDEEVHELQFRKILKDLPPHEHEELSEADRGYLGAISAAEIFQGNHDALTKVDQIEDRDGALEVAMQLERSSLLYYTAMRDVMGPSAALDAIINTEKEHLVRVMKYMVSGAKMRGLLEDY